MCWSVACRTSIEVGTWRTRHLKRRMVNINKGDEVRKNCRSRHVAKKIRRGPTGSLIAEFFAAMPPLSYAKFLLALACTSRVLDENGVLRKSSRTKCDLFSGVKRGHVMSPARTRIVVELPHQLREPEVHEVGLLHQQVMYGTKAATMCWEAEIACLLVGSMEFLQGRRSPCNFYNKKTESCESPCMELI